MTDAPESASPSPEPDAGRSAPPPWSSPGPGWAPQGWGPPPAPKPGVVRLQPMGVGEILEGAISTIRTHPTILLGGSAVVAVLTQILLLPVNAVALSGARGGAGSLTSVLASSVSSLVSAVVTLLLSGLFAVTVGRAVLGQGVTPREAWRLTRPRLPALLGATSLLLAALVALVALALAPGLVVAAAGASLVATVPLLLLGGLAGFAGVAYLYASYALAPAAAVLEREPARAALRRSRRLVTGSWWRTFGILLLAQVLAGVLAAILSAPFSIGVVRAALSGGAVGPVALGLSTLGATLAATVTWPFLAAVTTLLYLDLRMRRERLDVTLARAAMPGPRQ